MRLWKKGVDEVGDSTKGRGGECAMMGGRESEGPGGLVNGDGYKMDG